jgi:toxin ParE1/3/4
LGGQVLATYLKIGHTYRIEPEGEIHYRIAYLIREQSQVDIIGVFHGSLEIDRYLP